MLLTTLFMLFFFISSILMLINFIISKNKINDREKSSPFECGFDPISSSRLPFSIQFYLISIIFLIFDIEVVIFLPMIPSMMFSNKISWMILSLYFLFILLIGVYIEWKDGALTWLN